MRTRLTIAALAIASAAAVAFAQPHRHGQQHKPIAQPYAGQQAREVASLSAEEMQDLVKGRGMGLAKAAELNGHPGPSHVLELADQLGLTPEQRQLVKAAFERMQARARALGEAYIRAEKAVDQAFKAGPANATDVSARVTEANRLLGEVRLSHLLAHVEVTPLLTPEQRARYAELRGYASGGAHHQMHKH
jgi:Spy/CpxP family protein refolding chaperone